MTPTTLRRTALRVMILAFGFGLMAGCAQPPLRLRYDSISGVRDIVIADSATVNRHCRGKVTHTDDGKPITERTRFRACYDPDKEYILISRQDLCALSHELCHADGKPPDVCPKPPYRTQCP